MFLPANIWGGQLADRFSKKKLIILCDIVSIALFIVSGFLPLTLYTLCVTLVGAFFQTLEGAAYQALAADDDLSKISVTVLMLAGTETDFETQSVILIDKMNAMFDELASDTKVMPGRIGTDHGKMLYSSNGYAAAWFMRQRQGDEEAAKAFTGDSPEILAIDMYQDQYMKIEQ